MPPRKSDSSKIAIGDEGSMAGPSGGTGPSPSAAAKKEDGVNIEVDLNLPKSIVTRLAKGVLPPNTQIQGNAMLALSKSATVFVNYLSAHANEYAQNANRKTVAPADVFKALEDLEFDFKERLEAELAKFNEIQTEKRNTYRKKVAADKSSGAKGGSPAGGEGEPKSIAKGVNATASAPAAAAANSGTTAAVATSSDAPDGEPAAKKLRMDANANTNANGAQDETEDATSDLLEDGDTGEEEEAEEEEEEVGVDDLEEEEEEEGVDEEEEDIEEPHEEGAEEKEGDDGADEALDNGEDSD